MVNEIKKYGQVDLDSVISSTTFSYAPALISAYVTRYSKSRFCAKQKPFLRFLVTPLTKIKVSAL